MAKRGASRDFEFIGTNREQFLVAVDRDKGLVLDMGFPASPTTDEFNETTIEAYVDMPTETELIVIDRLTGHFVFQEISPRGGHVWAWEGTCAPTQRKF
jgi:hypothetical protein